MRARLVLLALPLLLAACAGIDPRAHDPALVGFTRPVELADTPFYPQTEFQCGPAALATVLSAADRPVQPLDLVPKVQLPGLRGSLQTELIAAARGYGVVPYRIAPTPAALLDELAAGRPVLVLQNLALASHPRWHYAVVIGYDPRGRVFILRSGTDLRREMKAGPFLRSWALAEHWGLVILRSGELPAADDATGLLKAVSGLEAIGQPALARGWYAAATRRWPQVSNTWLALGNASFALGDLAGAETAYRRVLALAPTDVVAHNNLAETLAGRGCVLAARALLVDALAVPGIPEQLRAVLLRTQAELAARRLPATVPRDCPAPAPALGRPRS